jgi:glycosyltransferase involved in cell wall biosynthesis
VPPDVTVVIPTHARPEKTLRAVRSAVRQDNVALEVVVVDDASRQPFAVPHELRAKGARVLRLDTNVGPAGARNAGAAAALAPFIAFLDSDDFLLPATLAKRLAFLRSLADAGRPTLLAASVWRWTPDIGAREARPVETDSVADLVSGCWYFPGSTSLMSRATWEAIGPLDANLRRLEDLDWGIRLGLAGGQLRVTPEPAVVIERSPAVSLARVEAAATLIQRRYGPDGEHRLDASDVSRLAAYLALEKARSALAERHFGAFAANLFRSLAGRPRLTLHQRRWWTSRTGSAADLATIEELARSLAA